MIISCLFFKDIREHLFFPSDKVEIDNSWTQIKSIFYYFKKIYLNIWLNLLNWQQL